MGEVGHPKANNNSAGQKNHATHAKRAERESQSPRHHAPTVDNNHQQASSSSSGKKHSHSGIPAPSTAHSSSSPHRKTSQHQHQHRNHSANNKGASRHSSSSRGHNAVGGGQSSSNAGPSTSDADSGSGAAYTQAELRDFRQALDSIVDCAVEECSGTRRMVEDEVNLVEELFKHMTNTRGKNSQISDILTQVDGFVHEWETSGKVSAAMQQLTSLLARPHIRSAIVAADDIANGRFSPELPPVPFEVDDDDGVAVKIIKLITRGKPVGVTIKKDSRNRIVIARVMADSVAEKSGSIQEGDRVIEINGVSVKDMEPAEIAQLMNEADSGALMLKLCPAPPPPPSASTCNIHVRALVDYNAAADRSHPCAESALSFVRGDILELVMVGDDYWWQARRLGRGALAGTKDEHSNSNGHTHRALHSSVGLIPSEILLRKRTGGTLTRSARDGLATIRSKSSKSSNESEDGGPYESVCRITSTTRPLPRPVLLIGAPSSGRNELKKRLITACPKRFASTIPHTTRPPRSSETNGVEYNFVSRSKMEAIIARGDMMEFGEYKGNLYGTSLSAIHQAAKKGTPLLTPHPLALRTLRSARFAPFIVFVRPPPKKDFIKTREVHRSSSRQRSFSEQEVDSIIDATVSIEKAYGAYFDAEITNGDLDSAVDDLVRLIDAFDAQPTWVPLSWATRDEPSSSTDDHSGLEKR